MINKRLDGTDYESFDDYNRNMNINIKYEK
jgi:hypothetical protein